LKKFIDILLIFLLFINSGGFILVFYTQQLSVKEEIFSSIRRGNYAPSEIIYFTIYKDQLYEDTENFVWNDKSEFEYDGKLYDIIRIVVKDNKLVLYCLNDLAEEKIAKSFEGELNRLVTDAPNDSKVKTSLFNLISQALIYHKYELLPPLNGQRLNYSARESILKYYTKVHLPPPKIC
jgi:hypothetical protein